MTTDSCFTRSIRYVRSATYDACAFCGLCLVFGIVWLLDFLYRSVIWVAILCLLAGTVGYVVFSIVNMILNITSGDPLVL